MDTRTITIVVCVNVIHLLVLIFLLIRRTQIARIAGFSWQRKVELEHYIWMQESSYEGYPEGCRNQYSTTETDYTYEVTGHNTKTTQNPDGTTSTTTEPVYSMVPHIRTKYIYEIQQWCKSRDVIARGDDHNPFWPQYDLDLLTHERVRATEEKYLVHFQTEKGKQYQHKLPESEWTALDDQIAYRLRLTLYGQVWTFKPAPTVVIPEQANVWRQQL